MERIHLKQDAFRRLTLCGILRSKAFRLVTEVNIFDEQEKNSICKTCLKVADEVRPRARFA
jgi:hypothetical protein